MDEVTKEPRSKAKVWASIVIGAMLVLAGGFGVFQTETMNNMFMEIGAEQTAEGIIEMHPDAAKAIGIAADTIDAAAQAREATPDHLAILITSALEDAGVEGRFIKPIITMVIEQLNEAYKVSSTEEIYLAKAQAVAAGLRKAVPVTE